MLEPWNDFETVSKTHYRMMRVFYFVLFFFFTLLMLTELTNYFFFFFFYQEMHSEQNPEVRQTGGGAKRVETVRDEITYNFVGANETLTRSILLLTAGQRKLFP